MTIASSPVFSRNPATADADILETLGAVEPRGYHPSDAIDEGALARALEAARWAPSASNTQPWRFIVARRGSAAYQQVVENLMGFNTVWAARAAVLIVAIAETATEDGTLTWARYDLGQAVAHFSIQAHHDGLFVHQMGGIEAAGLQSTFELDDRFVPMTVVAVGTLGDLESLPEKLQQREVAPRSRRALSETVLIDD